MMSSIKCWLTGTTAGNDEHVATASSSTRWFQVGVFAAGSTRLRRDAIGQWPIRTPAKINLLLPLPNTAVS